MDGEGKRKKPAARRTGVVDERAFHVKGTRSPAVRLVDCVLHSAELRRQLRSNGQERSPVSQHASPLDGLGLGPPRTRSHLAAVLVDPPSKARRDDYRPIIFFSRNKLILVDLLT